MQRLRKLGKMMEHNHMSDYINNDVFTTLYWNMFLGFIHAWLTKGQNKDPFNMVNPIVYAKLLEHEFQKVEEGQHKRKVKPRQP